VKNGSYQLRVGTTVGGTEYGSATTSAEKATIGGLPTDGRRVYGRPTTIVHGKTSFRDYRYGN
jgi:hypothetical protein